MSFADIPIARMMIYILSEGQSHYMVHHDDQFTPFFRYPARTYYNQSIALYFNPEAKKK
ncbi:MAG: hypothetical protein ACXWTP_01255 [Methylosarcina sp.]